MLVDDQVINLDGAHAQSGRPSTVGNICRMRIIIDKFLLKLFDNNKEKLKSLVKFYEVSLNDIYKEGGVSVEVNNKNLQLKFKVVDLLFHDEAFCRRHNDSPGEPFNKAGILFLLFVVVSCQTWRKSPALPKQDEAMLEAHATTDHSDVCLSYLFTAHDFNGVLGNISQSGHQTNLIGVC